MLDITVSDPQEMLTVNMLAVTLLCHALLPEMTGRGRGAIINISSVAGLIPLPYLAVYSATQHYISAFTQAIAQESKGSGVVIQEVKVLVVVVMVVVMMMMVVMMMVVMI